MGKKGLMNQQRELTVAALTGGVNVPSARFRVRSLIPYLKEQGVIVDEFISKFGQYPPAQKGLRPFWGTGALIDRFPAILKTQQYDVTFFQRELVSTFLTIEFLSAKPRVLDVDDAIFLHRNGRFAKKLAQGCDLVICGNDFLAENFSKWNSNIAVIPTAVDCNHYHPQSSEQPDDDKIIGWIGTSGNFKYLYQIEKALTEILRERSDIRLRIIADKRPAFHHLDSSRIDFIKWSPENEVTGIQGMTVGIMPLDDTDWVRGKCSFKMLQYMACGLPVVVSPVGMNAQILSMRQVGLAATSQQDWIDSILFLLSEPKECSKLGQNGRQIAVDNFSTVVIGCMLADQLYRVCPGFSR